MKLSIKNIGKLREAEVEINGITIVAGENNTGKSTVGKVLFSFLDSFSGLNKKRFLIKKNDVESVFFEFLENINKENIELIQKLSDEILKNNLDKSEILKAININENFISEKNLEISSEKIFEIVKIKNEKYSQIILTELLNKEFDNQVNSLGLNEIGEIILTIKSEEIKVKVNKNKVVEIENEKNLWNRVIYIDNPFVIDTLDKLKFFDVKYIKNHIENLESKLITNEINISKKILMEEKLKNIEKKIEEVISGKIRFNQDKWIYEMNDKNELNIKNLSTGLKTFAIIKMLLQNGSLEENGTIILDEPEIHLHPEWQLKFAELIVLLQKEFGMHILLTTHSPYFVSAVEVFSEKYKIDDKCKYYMAENIGNSSVIKDITNNTREIYRKMARPLQELENLRYSDYDE